MKRFCHVSLIILLIFLACGLSKRVEAQTHYTIGNPAGILPEERGNLNTLFGAVTLVTGDTITLYQDDSTLRNKTVTLPTTSTITIKSKVQGTMWTISMGTPGTPVALSGGIMSISNSMGAARTLVLDGIKFSGGNTTVDGGAIYTGISSTTLTINGGNSYTFQNNKAGGTGGAINATTLVFGSSGGTYTFSQNEGNIGGAIYAANVAFDGTGGTYIFDRNKSNASGAGGGAIRGGTTTFGGTGITYLFTRNSGGAGGGGAIWTTNPIFGGTGNTYTFNLNTVGEDGGAVHSGGQVQHTTYGGTGNTYTFNQNTASRNGGAIYDETWLKFDGANTFTFNKNTAVDNGGAIYFRSFGQSTTPPPLPLTFESPCLSINSGATFMGNMAGNLGGAIYFSAENANVSTPGNRLIINALATPTGSVLFSGNTMGGVSAIPNSIYFGNSTSSGRTATVNFGVEAGAKFEMLDPMASQQNLLTVNLDKTGLGTWVLGGFNDMQSETTWDVSQGKLFMVYNDYGSTGVLTPATINLANAGTADFTLKQGAGLIVEPGLSPHLIKGNNITLETGSTSEAAGFTYGPVLSLGHYVLLTLDAPDTNLVNNQAVVQSTGGTVTVGAFNYDYEMLQWERSGHDLAFDVIRKKLDPERGGSRAMTGPGEIVLRSHNLALDTFDQRAKALLGSCRSNPYDMRLRSNLWATPSYFSTRHSQKTGGGFDVSATAVTFGYDRRLNNADFIGIGAMVGSPKYSAMKTDIKTDDFAVVLYGGKKLSGNELTGRIGQGYSNFNQVRGVANEWYASQYDGHSFFTGVGLSRLYLLSNPSFCLRPGINYDFLHLVTNGFHENGGTYALHIDNHAQNLHRVKAGLDVNWQPSRWFQATYEFYYLGMYGDRAAQARASFINDPVNSFTTAGYPIEQNNLGLGIQLTLPLDRWELSGGYTALIARDTTSQQAALSAVFKF